MIRHNACWSCLHLPFPCRTRQWTSCPDLPQWQKAACSFACGGRLGCKSREACSTGSTTSSELGFEVGGCGRRCLWARRRQRSLERLQPLLHPCKEGLLGSALRFKATAELCQFLGISGSTLAITCRTRLVHQVMVKADAAPNMHVAEIDPIGTTIRRKIAKTIMNISSVNQA